MNPELKSKWLDALRSGKYKQGIGYLKSFDGYCCLGVLCDVAGLKRDGDSYYFGNYSSRINLPGNFANIELRNQQILQTMNDMERKTFLQIADWIEKNL